MSDQPNTTHQTWDAGERFRCSCGWASVFMMDEISRSAAIDERAQHISSDQVPTTWLVDVLKLINQMAGEGVGMENCADPADLMAEIARFLEVADEEDWLGAAVRKLQGRLPVSDSKQTTTYGHRMTWRDRDGSKTAVEINGCRTSEEARQTVINRAWAFGWRPRRWWQWWRWGEQNV